MRILLITSFIFITACGSYKGNDSRYKDLPDTKIRKSSTTDSDNDGVRDKFDQCPNTSKGVSVNSHGCPKDTDGDGVADHKDKELITPSYCQPSDKDGVGKCPPRKD